MEAMMKTMDWYPWLRRAFDPSYASEYACLFSRNELEEEDIGEFTHDFLLSMGISVAKHRLKILKLARGERRRRPTPPLASILLAVVDKAKKGLARLVVAVHRDRCPLMVTMPPTPARSEISTAWRAAGLKKNKRVSVNNKQGISPTLVPLVHGGGGGGGGGEFNWDSMFQNLKPT